jgi:hypothetical protein
MISMASAGLALGLPMRCGGFIPAIKNRSAFPDTEDEANDIWEAARGLGIQIVVVRAGKADDLDDALAPMMGGDVTGTDGLSDRSSGTARDVGNDERARTPNTAAQMPSSSCTATSMRGSVTTMNSRPRMAGRFNLVQGIVGSGIAIGASLSTTLAGWMSDRLGSSVAFLGLACIGGAGLVLAALPMPDSSAPSCLPAYEEGIAGMLTIIKASLLASALMLFGELHWLPD